MSRSIRGGKAPGYEFWSKRPGNRGGSSPGAATKKQTHRVERQQGKKECHAAVKGE